MAKTRKVDVMLAALEPVVSARNEHSKRRALGLLDGACRRCPWADVAGEGVFMTPTPEQLEAVIGALRSVPDEGGQYDIGGSFRSDEDMAIAAWNVIAPIVRAQALEEAAEVCSTMAAYYAFRGEDGIFARDAEYRIRALSSNK